MELTKIQIGIKYTYLKRPKKGDGDSPRRLISLYGGWVNDFTKRRTARWDTVIRVSCVRSRFS